MHFSLYHTIQPLAPDAINLVSVDSMRVISHAIEDVVLHHSQGAVLSAGFQRTSFFRLQEARYRSLARVCSAISVYAVSDIHAPAIEPITYVSLAPESPLAREWFLVVNTPDFACQCTQACTNFNTVLLQQQATHTLVVQTAGNMDGVELWQARVFGHHKINAQLSQTCLQRQMVAGMTCPSVFQSFLLQAEQRFVQGIQAIGRCGMVIGARGFAPVT